mmetsp:Transcript_34712/g.98357  ORF Transcript_34712/g.98357 Transcript_34712/m.98357 type:complete len:464 (-) Transcript_34712:373-1764(-)|eukprot:CAMPEP_0117657910 /NCGR_PEP_ID=MMETSP0804-20121206/5581_1 /TAXON_ID=1074897 /ORGANISM="Tetraselmis astigmatica, Strain CCMP880" /LENGTH=463 /DNA_ID=CAMNT_0005464393 /DNA_START=533 /DNA_END=1924 /DNA_ORIENTATION=+
MCEEMESSIVLHRDRQKRGKVAGTSLWWRVSFDVVQHIVANDVQGLAPLMRLVCKDWQAAVAVAVRDLRPADIRCVGKFPRLVSLTTESCHDTVDDSALEPLKDIGTLRILALNHCQFLTDRGIDHVAQLPMLTSLSVADCHYLTDLSLNTLQRSTCRLTQLDISGCFGVTSAGLNSFLRNAGQSLSVLRLEEMSPTGQFTVTDSTLQIIQQLTLLSSLSLPSNDGFTDDGLKSLASLTGLTSLDLGDCSQVTGRGVQSLAGLTQLTSIDLSSTGIDDESVLQLLKSLKNIRSMQLCACENLTSFTLSHLSIVAPQLEELGLRSNLCVTDSAMQALGALSGLKKLDLGFCVAVSDHGLLKLRNMTRLEELSLGGCLWVTGSWHTVGEYLDQPSDDPVLTGSLMGQTSLDEDHCQEQQDTAAIPGEDDRLRQAMAPCEDPLATLRSLFPALERLEIYGSGLDPS